MNQVHEYLNEPEVIKEGFRYTTMDTTDIIKRAVKVLSAPVIATMGANGTYHAFNKRDSFGNKQPEITNDGVTVADSLFPLADAQENLLATYVLEAARKTSHIAGDGTTRTIATIESLTNELVGNVTNPYKVQEGINLAIEAAKTYIEKNKKKVNLNTLWKVAYTSSHGNKKVADNIKSLYKHLKNWNIDISFEDGDWEDALSIKEGYRIGIKSPSVTVQTPPKIMNPRLILFNDRLNDFGILTMNIHVRALRDASPVIILTRDITQDMITLAKESKNNYNVEIWIVKVDTFGLEVDRQFEDIQFLASVEQLENGEYVWRRDTILTNNSKNTIKALQTKDDPAPFYEHRIESALLTNEEVIFEFKADKDATDWYVQNMILNETFEDKILQRNQNQRIERLKAISCTYYVGGNSVMDIQTNKYLVEDALLACRSAIRKGVVPGGGWFDIQLSNYLEKNLEKYSGEVRKGYVAVINSLRYGLRLMCESGYKDYNEIYKAYSEDSKLFNFSTFEFESIEKSNIMDSASTILEVLSNSQSVINHFIKTKSLTI